MDLLGECALAFQKLLTCKYYFIIGRKGQRREFWLTFEKSDFHHLAGLHKLKDIQQLQRGMRDKIFDKIVAGEISQDLICKSTYYHQMSNRLYPLTDLEKMLDDNRVIFRYNERAHNFSLIQADYLLEGQANAIPSFLFLGKRGESEQKQMCRTFFQKEDKDYTIGQAQYTLLRKIKINLEKGTELIQYNRLTTE